MRHGAFVAALGLSVAFTQIAHAGVITFDADGALGANSPVQVATFDLLPGNSLAKNALLPGIGFVQFYQSRLGSLLDSNHQVIPTPGLNAPGGFEITMIAAYPATSAVNGSIVTTQATGGPSYIKMYFDNNPATQSNDLTGTGFNDGTLIYQGTISTASSVISFGSPNALSLLDQFGPDNWAGQQTIGAIGGLLLTAATVSDNIAFFPQGLNVTGLAANSSSALPYMETDPSHQFVGIDGVTPVIPALGAVNGISGPDVIIEADANATFSVVPEPASVGLLALGAMALLRKRTNNSKI